jgi:Domain of unknown function (DUF4129)
MNARAAFLVALAVLAAGEARAQALTPAQYAARLSRLEGALRTGALDEARAQATALLSAHVQSGASTLQTDSSVLHPTAEVRTAVQAAALATRVAAIRNALPGGAGRGTEAADPALLARLAEAQRAAPLAGGEVTLPVRIPDAPPSLGERLHWLMERFLRAMEALMGWLGRLWPEQARPSADRPGQTILGVALLVGAVASVLAVLGVRALRRRGAAEPSAVSAAPLSSERDCDPLARDVSGWERHAEALAAAGRWREAVRAWYHAVLVALFRAGLLHHEKGRTNWEYAARLSPEHAWRPTFLSLTRRFDREWYGRTKSGEDACRACADDARVVLDALAGA